VETVGEDFDKIFTFLLICNSPNMQNCDGQQKGKNNKREMDKKRGIGLIAVKCVFVSIKIRTGGPYFPLNQTNSLF